jgi:hypothetical protein
MFNMATRHGLGDRFLFVALDKRAASFACNLKGSEEEGALPAGVALLDEAT